MTVMRRLGAALAVLVLVAACTPSASPPASSTVARPSPGCGAVEPEAVEPEAGGCLGPAAPTEPSMTRPSSDATPEPTPPASQAAGDLVFTTQTYRVPNGAHPHDVAIASDGGVWYTGQLNGTLGWLDPASGEVREAALPSGAAPHGVVTGPDGAAWVTDQGLNAIVRVTPGDFEVEVFPAPGTSPHTPVFDADGMLWFTGAAGYVGRLDPATGKVDRYRAPRGPGPYGLTVTPSNEIWFVSLQGSYLGRVDKATGDVTLIEPPTPGAGTRRVWSDSTGRLWISYWNAGMVAVYDPAADAWQEWDLPGRANQAYSMYVDELDAVWLSDFGQNAVVRFDPATESFLSFPLERRDAAVRQMLGRPGEAWGAESGIDRLIVIRYAAG